MKLPDETLKDTKLSHMLKFSKYLINMPKAIEVFYLPTDHNRVALKEY
jgi:hypothetical protein